MPDDVLVPEGSLASLTRSWGEPFAPGIIYNAHARGDGYLLGGYIALSLLIPILYASGVLQRYAVSAMFCLYAGYALAHLALCLVQQHRTGPVATVAAGTSEELTQCIRHYDTRLQWQVPCAMAVCCFGLGIAAWSGLHNQAAVCASMGCSLIAGALILGSINHLFLRRICLKVAAAETAAA